MEHAGGIYLLGEGGLVELTEESVDREDALQGDLASYPRLLAGEQMDPDSPRRWALVAREAAVPDKEGGSQRWSADHLFVDQDAIPTIVEVKRGADTRIRREVVGQMLDYVAHASSYWDESDLRSRFEESQTTRDRTPETVLAELTGDEDLQPAQFWEQAEANLRSGHVRLLFVADEVPPELRTVVEFLSEQLDPAEAFAVEVTQYSDGDREAYVPRLYGHTDEPTSTTRPDHDSDDFLSDVSDKQRDGNLDTAEAEALRDLHEFAHEHADEVDYGGSANVSLQPEWEALEGSRTLFSANTGGHVEIWMPNFNQEDRSWPADLVASWYDDIAALDHDGVPDRSELPDQGSTGKFPLGVVVDDENRAAFVDACERFVAAVQNHSA
jgi:hypothetical protein